MGREDFTKGIVLGLVNPWMGCYKISSCSAWDKLDKGSITPIQLKSPNERTNITSPNSSAPPLTSLVDHKMNKIVIQGGKMEKANKKHKRILTYFHLCRHDSSRSKIAMPDDLAFAKGKAIERGSHQQHTSHSTLSHDIRRCGP